MDDTTDSSFEIDQIGSSTPMNSSFLSPIKRLDNLNLNNLSDINEDDIDEGTNDDITNILPEDNHQQVNHPNDYNYEYSGDEYELGDQTIEHSTDEEDLIMQKPVFINKRKRDTSDIEMITPTSNHHTSASTTTSSHYGTKMSICSNVTSTSLSNFKLSFSNSDSTPCPPMKKKFKYETPNKKKVLNLSHSIKTSVDELPEFKSTTPADPDHDHYEVSGSSSPIQIIKNHQQSTPISQSTPSNSRAASPILESSQSINGYRLINRQVPHPPLDTDNLVPTQSTQPSDDESFEQGDQRINDPYLEAPEILVDNLEIRNNYMLNRFKLPLLVDLPCHKFQILQQLTTENILAFYKFIKLPDESLSKLLKNERIKWHPDKWINETFDKDFIANISKSINEIIETYEL